MLVDSCPNSMFWLYWLNQLWICLKEHDCCSDGSCGAHGSVPLLIPQILETSLSSSPTKLASRLLYSFTSVIDRITPRVASVLGKGICPPPSTFFTDKSLKNSTFWLHSWKIFQPPSLTLPPPSTLRWIWYPAARHVLGKNSIIMIWYIKWTNSIFISFV